MKKLILKLTAILLLSIGLVNCKKSCKKDIAGCTEAPTNGATCLAYFESWFFAEGDNKCVKIGYSGCNERGFKTEAECKVCECNN